MNADETAASAGSWDAMGIFGSALCAAHCLLAPLLLAGAPALALWLPGEETGHRIFAVGLAVVAALAGWRGWRLHRRRRVPLLLAAGVGLLVLAAFAAEALALPGGETALVLAGSGMLVAGHWSNRAFCCRAATPPVLIDPGAPAAENSSSGERL